MSFAFRLAWRYLRTQKTRPLARLTAWIAIIGTAGGLAAFIIAQSLANGFREQLQEKILANTAHILVYRNDGADFADFQETISKIQQNSNVKSANATTYRNALLLHNDNFNYAVLRAVEDSKIPQFQDSEISGFQDSKQTIEISVGQELAEKSGLKIGDIAKIIAVSDEFSAPNAVEVKIVGTFRTGLYEYDSTWIYLSLEDAARIAGKSQITATAINISLNNVDKAEKVSLELQKTLGNEFKILSWQEANRPLFAAMTFERRIVLFIISLIVLLAVLNITTNLALLVNERRADIAVLRTCGAKTHQIIFIFLIEGLFLGAIGAVSGIWLSLLICWLCNYFRLISLPEGVYSVNEVQFLPQVSEIIYALFALILLSLAASLFPARLAAQIKPWTSLQNRN